MGKSLSKIDLYVKQKVVTDAIMLAKKAKTKVLETEKFGSLERVLPIANPESPEGQVSATIICLRKLYYDLAPIKSKLSLNNSNFERLYPRSSFVVVNYLNQVDLCLIF